MYAQKRMNLYKQQSVQTSPAQLVAKLYDLGIRACREDDRALAEQLYGLYQYCMQESATGDLRTIADLLDDLRTTWRQHVLRNRAA
ncbi:MAG: flagellar protein FliS [Bacteroidetes bacterium]|jgi:flagellar protein FliS|nr:flagellar protein FliS [Bacteroidota bacterium]